MGEKYIAFHGCRYKKNLYDFGNGVFFFEGERPPSRRFPNGIKILQWIGLEKVNQGDSDG